MNLVCFELMLLPSLQEMITLSIAIPLFDDDSLSPVNIGGMVVCLIGVCLHVALKIKRAKGESTLFGHMYIT